MSDAERNAAVDQSSSPVEPQSGTSGPKAGRVLSTGQLAKLVTAMAGGAGALALAFFIVSAIANLPGGNALRTATPTRPGSGPPSGDTPTNSPAALPSAQPGAAAKADVVVDGKSYARSGGTCKAGFADGTYYWALTFIGPGADYFSILLSADAPIDDGSYAGSDTISTLVIEGVADYNVRIDMLDLRDNLSHGAFSGSADAGRISISGTFDCSGSA